MIYLFIALIFYTLSILISAAASRNLNTNVAAAITNVISAVIPVAVALPLLSRKTVTNYKFGIFMAVAGGICIAFFVMALNKSFSLNKIGIVTPIIYGGAILLSTILSTLVFKEKITPIESIGLAVLAMGFGIIVYARAFVK